MSEADAITLRAALLQARAESARLAQENQQMREQLGLRSNPPLLVPRRSTVGPSNADSTITQHSPTDAKVRFFRELFRGREDVYAVRWIGRDGKAGYSPAGQRDWSERDTDGKPRRRLFPLTDKVIYGHLAGEHTVGVYPLRHDETCGFLAADFDKSTWQDDAAAFLATCAEWQVPAALERSRSGNGGHMWFFFEQPVPAVLARKLGSALLTRTMERRHQLGLDSYDRLFPNQDTMPIRHEHTRYDELLMRHGDRQLARAEVRARIENLLARWEFAASQNAT